MPWRRIAIRSFLLSVDAPIGVASSVIGPLRSDGSAVASSARTRAAAIAGNAARLALLEGPLLEGSIRRQPVGQLAEVDRVAVELGAVDAGVAGLAVDVTRQPPHIPVPSTMIALSETRVGTPNGPGQLADGAHHRDRSDRVDGVDAAGLRGRPRAPG